MNFRKLLTYLTMGTAAAMPIATAQNPTILQGNYITNVFGNSNFVLNPNAQTNIANVTVSTATVTRSTTTPLVATSEFNVTITAANGTVTWDARAFDAGMKNQNCEARFTYRGFQSTSKVQIKQSTNVIAELALTPSTDPRIVSINFPCGDLSQLTKFVVTDTSTLSGVHEIGGIYVGLATNMANVAQAEFVGSLTWGTASDSNALSNTGFTPFGNFTTSPTPLGTLTSPSNGPQFTIPAFKPGNYRVILTGMCMVFSASTSDATGHWRLTDGTTQYGSVFVARNLNPTAGANIGDGNSCGSFDFQYTGATTSKTFQVEGYSGGTNTTMRLERTTNVGFQISVYRFPSSSELVVTPERQNVFGSIDGNGLDSTTTSTSFVTPSGFTITGTQGRCQADGTNIACKISTLPPGMYKIDVTLPYIAVAGSVSQNCLLQIKDNKGIADAVTGQASASISQTDAVTTVSRTVRYAAVQSDIVFSFQHRQSTGTGGSCGIYTNGANRFWQMNVIPLDQPSNSALYVQGPVLGAQTGATIPAGYLGNLIFKEGSATNLTTGTWVNLTSQALSSPGVYLINANATFKRNAATYSLAEYFVIAFSQANNADNTAYTFARQGMFFRNPGFSTTFDEIAVATNTILIRYDGTTITWPNGSTTTGGTLYLNAFNSIVTAGTPQVTNPIMNIIRLN